MKLCVRIDQPKSPSLACIVQGREILITRYVKSHNTPRLLRSTVYHARSCWCTLYDGNQWLEDRMLVVWQHYAGTTLCRSKSGPHFHNSIAKADFLPPHCNDYRPHPSSTEILLDWLVSHTLAWPMQELSTIIMYVVQKKTLMWNKSGVSSSKSMRIRSFLSFFTVTLSFQSSCLELELTLRGNSFI